MSGIGAWALLRILHARRRVCTCKEFKVDVCTTSASKTGLKRSPLSLEHTRKLPNHEGVSTLQNRAPPVVRTCPVLSFDPEYDR